MKEAETMPELGESNNWPDDDGGVVVSQDQDNGTLIVSRDQLEALVALNNELKSDIIALVNVFGIFSGLLSGEDGFTKLITIIPKIMKDKATMARIAAIVPVIEKYTANPAENLSDGKE